MSMKDAKVFIKILLAVMAFLSLMILTHVFLDRALPLDFELVNSMQSPDNVMTLYVYSVNGGATSDYSYRLAISPDKNFDEADKDDYFFHFDTDHGAASKDIGCEWIDASNVKITCDKKVRVFRQRNKTGSVNIQYEKITAEQK